LTKRVKTSAHETASSDFGVVKQRGFTMIELLIVVALIAMASGLVTFALRDPAATRLEQEAGRLTALLESARAEARASGLRVIWEPVSAEGTGNTERDFRFVGLPASTQMPTRWIAPGVVADVVGSRIILLGPEPIIGAQRILLRLDNQRLSLVTDGMGPFNVTSNVTNETP
jgi:general secretion pathway protein H